ncbi:MAG: DM13 domain-containing protein [Actinomycetota bacterium]
MNEGNMQQGSGSARRRALLVAAGVAAIIGIPMAILQRYIAATRGGAILLILAWFVVSGIGLFLYFRRRPGSLIAAATYAAVLLGTVAIGYWTGFRDNVVDEDVVVATAQASGAERDRGLAEAQGGRASRRAPVELAMGEFAGADGHAGSGTASMVQEPSGQRLVTFTDFDVDPGVDVDVYLVPGDGSDVSDRVELGNLKGNVGDQQYEIPADADLSRYSTVVLWCKPFTVRIAVAPLNV